MKKVLLVVVLVLLVGFSVLAERLLPEVYRKTNHHYHVGMDQ